MSEKIGKYKYCVAQNTNIPPGYRYFAQRNATQLRHIYVHVYPNTTFRRLLMQFVKIINV